MLTYDPRFLVFEFMDNILIRASQVKLVQQVASFPCLHLHLLLLFFLIHRCFMFSSFLLMWSFISCFFLFLFSLCTQLLLHLKRSIICVYSRSTPNAPMFLYTACRHLTCDSHSLAVILTRSHMTQGGGKMVAQMIMG